MNYVEPINISIIATLARYPECPDYCPTYWPLFRMGYNLWLMRVASSEILEYVHFNILIMSIKWGNGLRKFSHNWPYSTVRLQNNCILIIRISRYTIWLNTFVLWFLEYILLRKGSVCFWNDNSEEWRSRILIFMVVFVQLEGGSRVLKITNNCIRFDGKNIRFLFFLFHLSTRSLVIPFFEIIFSWPTNSRWPF